MGSAEQNECGYWKQDLGWRFRSPTVMDIRLRSEPSGEHFDPEFIGFVSITPAGLLQKGRISYATGCSQIQTALGPITLSDQAKRKPSLRLFTFGGEAKIQQDLEAGCRDKIVTIASRAPIIPLSPELNGNMQDAKFNRRFVEGIQAIIARERATWGQNHAGFDLNLITWRPEVLYASAFQFELTRALDDRGDPDEIRAYRNHLRRLYSQNPISGATPELLLPFDQILQYMD